MEQPVILKSNRYGINLILNNDLPFLELTEAVLQKFHEAEKFFKNASIAISFSGRKLSIAEEIYMVEAITANTGIHIICVLDTNPEEEDLTQARIADYLRKQEESTGQFYKGTLHAGQVLESETSIVVVGNVEPGAKIIARGNIVVLGQLAGQAYAGADGNPEAFVAALAMNPIQIKIADFIGHTQEKSPLGKLLGRKKTSEPQVAYVKEEAIQIQTLKDGELENLF